MKLNFKVRTRILSAALVVGCAVMVATTYHALRTLKVGGELFGQIVLGKDLLADILPPPVYVIEPFLEATLALNDPNSVDEHKDRLKALHKEYDDRKAYWLSHDFDLDLKTMVTKDVESSVSEFWRITETELLPALGRRDLTSARIAYGRLSEVYGVHRQLIDTLVKKANHVVSETELAASWLNTLLMSAFLAVSLTMVGLILASAFSLEKGLVAPLSQITSAMRSLASGQLDIALPNLDRKDELGEISNAVEQFRLHGAERAANDAKWLREDAEQKIEAERQLAVQHATEARRRNDQEAALQDARRATQEAAVRQERELVIASIGAGLKKLASRDMTFRLNTELPEAYLQLQADFNQAMDALDRAISDVARNASTVSSGSSQISVASEDLSRRVENQAAALEQSAAALQQISSTVQSTARNAELAGTIVSLAKGEATRTVAAVEKTVVAMGAIENSSREINQIIGVIDEIAFQTNLLALNAGVEAARAGDAGRGFAVVASEVRTLAQRAAESAKQIKALISASSSQVVDGATLVSQTGQSIRDMVLQIEKVDKVMSDIVVSTKEQAVSTAEINTAIAEMDHATQSNAAMVEQTTAAAKELARTGQTLRSLVDAFKTSSQSSDYRDSTDKVFNIARIGRGQAQRLLTPDRMSLREITRDRY